MVIHVASECQHADFLTKPLSKDSFEFHGDFLINWSHVLRAGTCREDIDIRLNKAGLMFASEI